MITVSIRTYNWGKLRIIRRDNSYSCIIHPEHAALIASLKPGFYTSFQDEQGTIWMVERKTYIDGDTLCFTAGYRRLVVQRHELELNDDEICDACSFDPCFYVVGAHPDCPYGLD